MNSAPWINLGDNPFPPSEEEQEESPQGRQRERPHKASAAAGDDEAPEQTPQGEQPSQARDSKKHADPRPKSGEKKGAGARWTDQRTQTPTADLPPYVSNEGNPLCIQNKKDFIFPWGELYLITRIEWKSDGAKSRKITATTKEMLPQEEKDYITEFVDGLAEGTPLTEVHQRARAAHSNRQNNNDQSQRKSPGKDPTPIRETKTTMSPTQHAGESAQEDVEPDQEEAGGVSEPDSMRGRRGRNRAECRTWPCQQ